MLLMRSIENNIFCQYYDAFKLVCNEYLFLEKKFLNEIWLQPEFRIY